MGGEAGPSRVPASLRAAGAWSGLIEVLLDEWTVQDLRAEVSRRSGFALLTVNLISCGRILKDGEQGKVNSPTLRETGLKENSKILITRIGGEQANAVNRERERSERLSRIKAAAVAMAERSNESSPVDEDSMTLNIFNQSGDQMMYESDDDRRALVMGLMLHAKASALLKRAQYMEALEVLAMAEEALSLCSSKVLEKVDNQAILQLDTVWCFFMLRDISRLAVARERLSIAREGLSRSHGSNLERLQVLHQGFSPELAIYCRLELLEGVVAYHSGNFEAARKSLASAHSKYQRLQVSDEAVAQLASMGFTAVESRRALQMSGQDIQRAVEFTMEERIKKEERKEKDRRERRERREQRSFGKTPRGKAVDMTRLAQLLSIGYEKRVAAEALRKNENDLQLALDLLSNPATLLSLHIDLEARALNGEVDGATLSMLLSMGFDRESATQAVQNSGSTSEAIDRLHRMELLQMEWLQIKADALTTAVQDMNSSVSSDSLLRAQSLTKEANDLITAMQDVNGPYSSSERLLRAALLKNRADDLIAAMQEVNNSNFVGVPGIRGSSDAGEDEPNVEIRGSSDGGEDEPNVENEVRDEEMEEDIAANLSGDPLDQYDLELDKEGEAISEYIGLIDGVKSLVPS